MSDEHPVPSDVPAGPADGGPGGGGGAGDGSPRRPRRPRGNRRAAVAVIVASAVVLVACVVAAFVLLGSRDPNAGIVLSDDLVVYDEQTSPFTITASDADSVVVSSTDGLEVGSILNAGPIDAAPSGLLRRVDSIEQVDGGYRLHTTQAALTDAIESCDITATVSFSSDGSYEVDWTNNATGGQLLLTETAYADELDNILSAPLCVNDDGELVLDDSEGDRLGDVSIGNAIEADLKVDHGDIDISVVNHFYAGLKLRGLSCSVSQSLLDHDFPPVTIPVGPLVLVLNNGLSVDFEAAASLSALGFEGSASIDRSFGFGYRSGEGLRSINEDESQEPTLDLTPDDGTELVSADLSAGLEAALSCRLYGVAGPELGIGLSGELEAKLQALSDGEDGEGAIELPGTDVRFKGHARAVVSIPITGSFKAGVDANIFDGDDGIDLLDVTLFDTDDAISWTILDQSFGTVSHTYVLPAIEGPTSGSDGMAAPGAETGRVPALAVDYPDGWEVRNERVEDGSGGASPWASVDLVDTETGATLTLSTKVGANGGALSGDESVEVLGQTGIEGVEAVIISGGGGGWSYQRLCLRSTASPQSEYVPIDGGSVQLSLSNPGAPPDSSTELFREMVDIMCSLRVAE